MGQGVGEMGQKVQRFNYKINIVDMGTIVNHIAYLKFVKGADPPSSHHKEKNCNVW